MNIWKPVAIYCIGYIAGGNKIKKEHQKIARHFIRPAVNDILKKIES